MTQTFPDMEEHSGKRVEDGLLFGCITTKLYFCKNNIMAITIKNIPVLEGVTAEDFVRSADKNAAKVTPRLSVEAKKRLRKVLEKSRSFRFN